MHWEAPRGDNFKGSYASCERSQRVSCPMTNHAEEVTIKGVAATNAGIAVFLGASDKTLMIHVDQFVASALTMAVSGERGERPSTHDLIGDIFSGLGVSVQHAVISDVSDETFFARIVLQMDNELGTKIVDVDARPSDAMVLAMQAKKPIFVVRKVIDNVEDMTEVFERLSKKQK